MYRSQKLNSYFLIFEEAQDYGDRFNILPDLGKDSNSFDSQVLWIISEFVLKAILSLDSTLQVSLEVC